MELLLDVVYLSFNRTYFTSYLRVHCLYLGVEASHHVSHEVHGIFYRLLMALLLVNVASQMNFEILLCQEVV